MLFNYFEILMSRIAVVISAIYQSRANDCGARVSLSLSRLIASSASLVSAANLIFSSFGIVAIYLFSFALAILSICSGVRPAIDSPHW